MDILVVLNTTMTKSTLHLLLSAVMHLLILPKKIVGVISGL